MTLIVFYYRRSEFNPNKVLPDLGFMEIERRRRMFESTEVGNPFFLFFCVCVKAEGVKHSGPAKMVLYFTGATNILYTFGGHAVTV